MTILRAVHFSHPVHVDIPPPPPPVQPLPPPPPPSTPPQPPKPPTQIGDGGGGGGGNMGACVATGTQVYISLGMSPGAAHRRAQAVCRASNGNTHWR